VQDLFPRIYECVNVDHFQSWRINVNDVTPLLYSTRNNQRVKRSGESRDMAYSPESFSTRSRDRNVYFRGPAKTAVE